MSEKKETKRGKCYKPRWSACTDCGAKFWKDTARRTLCDTCRKKHEEDRKEQNRERARKSYIRKREGLEPVRQLPKVQEPETGFVPHQCLVTQECKYGDPSGKSFCNYFTTEDKLRTSGGRHKIIQGRCDAFKPAVKREETGWQERAKEDWERRQKQKEGEAND